MSLAMLKAAPLREYGMSIQSPTSSLRAALYSGRLDGDLGSGIGIPLCVTISAEVRAEMSFPDL